MGLFDKTGMLLGFAGGGPEGAIQGKRSDMLAAAQRQEQEDKAKKIEWAKSIAPQLGMDAETLAKNPEVAQSLYATVMGHKLVPKELSFEERQFNQLDKDQQAAYRQQHFLGGDKPTDDIREYQYDMKQRVAQGGQIVPFGEWMASTKKPQNVIQNIPAQVEKTEDIERAKKNVDYLSGVSADSGKIAQRSADLDFLGRVVSKTNTGPGADLRATLDGIGQGLGMTPGTLKSQADAIKAITNRIAPTLRQAGSGSQSDAELAGFLSALPNLTANPQGNQLIASTLQRASKIDRERTKIASQFSSGRITATEARQKIADLDEQSIFASEEEKKVIENSMGLAPQSGGEKAKKGWKILGWE
jgi:hypothetical protein